MKTILITGAYGFVGTNLAGYLRMKYRLWALDLEKKEEGLYERFFSWKQLDEIPFDKIDALIHLAGKAHDTRNENDSVAYFEINTRLTQTVYDHFASSSGALFIFFSSVKAAAESVQGDTLTEEALPHPIGPYGESKRKAEEYLLAHLPEEGKRVYILRPCMIHGPGNKGNLNLLYAFVSKGFPYPLGAFHNKRSFTSVGNLCFLIDRILTNRMNSGIYNIADDDPLSTNELIRTMCQAMKRPVRIWSLPRRLIQACAGIGDFLHLPLTTFRLNKLTENYVVSNEKIKQALHLKDLPVSPAEGITDTIRSFAKKGKKTL